MAARVILFLAGTQQLLALKRCSSNLDCSLNGDCVAGRCKCDPAWSGSLSCDVLAFEATPRQGGYHNHSFASWGGNAIFVNGTYHLFVAQMENHCGLDKWGSNSAIIRAEAKSVLGPYEYRETVFGAFAHNPTVRQMPDGRFAMYMIGSGAGGHPVNCSDPAMFDYHATFNGSIHVSVSSSVLGPWSTPDQVAFANSSDQLHCCGYTNPSPHFEADGTIYLAFQSQPGSGKAAALVGLARAQSLSGPFEYLSAAPVTPDRAWCVAGQDEDPFFWRSKRGFHIVTHGMCPSGYLQAHYKFSADGVTWHTSPKETYHYRVSFDDGSVVNFPRMERPQLLFSETAPDGTVSRPVALVNGVCDDGPNYVAAFWKCTLKQAGMTWTLVRPLAQESIISV